MLLYCLWANSQVQNLMSKCCLHHPTFVAILMSGHFNFLFLGRFKVQVLKVRPRSLIEEALLWHRTGNVVTTGNNKRLSSNNTRHFCTLLSAWSCFPSVTVIFLAVAFIALFFVFNTQANTLFVLFVLLSFTYYLVFLSSVFLFFPPFLSPSSALLYYIISMFFFFST